MADPLIDAPAGEFVFTDEQRALRDAVRGFCAEYSDEAAVRGWMQSDPPVDRATWRRLGTELGVLGLGVPEELGGVGGGTVDAAIVAEELGAALLCGPVFGTVFTAIPALVAAPASAARTDLLGPLVDGARTAAFAVPERGGRFAADAVRVRADEGASGWTLSGGAGRVVDGADADDLLVAALTADGVALFAVDAHGPGVRRTALTTLDLTRPQGTVDLDGAPARLLAAPGEAARVCEHALRTAAVLLAAEQVGASQLLLDISVAYAKDRVQFGRVIGSFQAVKHRLADMLVEQEHARSAALHAAWALQDGLDDPALAASIAQAVCSATGTRIATDAVQVHGGIGFTWEHRIHLYYKRLVTDAALMGSAEEHRGHVAEAVLDAAIAGAELPVAVG